ncbi:MAG: tyrosine-type recombinase/integrase, partial [Desulfobulbaceae bacterium]|nr:tyrosine-type recombinase/integrase [Desulfobulbaceae bacterium]
HLRHTFATEMLNSGMRIEVLQQILGHQSIEQTMRYARLSDKTREEEYFRAMNVIEKGGNHEPYRISNALQKVFEEKKLLRPQNKKLPE